MEREREPVRREDMTGHPASLSRLLHSLPAGSFTSATGKSRDTMAGTRSGPSLTLTLPTPFPLSLVSFLTSLATPLSRRTANGRPLRGVSDGSGVVRDVERRVARDMT